MRGLILTCTFLLFILNNEISLTESAPLKEKDSISKSEDYLKKVRSVFNLIKDYMSYQLSTKILYIKTNCFSPVFTALYGGKNRCI